MSGSPVSQTVTLKLATSLDGRIALANGASQWITGPESRARVHRLRGEHDVLLTGAGTVRSDDPLLTVRGVPGFSGPQPACAILDTRASISPEATLFRADRKVLVFTAQDAAEERVNALESAGAEVISVRMDSSGRPALAAALDALLERGYARVMIEAGAGLGTAALMSRRLNRIAWFRAPSILGGDALPVVAALGLETLRSAPQFRRTLVEEVGADLLEIYKREPG